MPHNPHADFTPTLAGYSGITPFRFWCQTALPLTYDDSLSYYELLNKVVSYLNHTIEDLTNVENNTSELAEAYDKLQKYVNDYFDDIDIETELRNVLDGMAEDGTLDALLDPLVANRLPGVVEDQISGVVAEQIDGAVEGQIDDVVGEQLPPLVDANIGEEVSDWLEENVDPVGSAVMVDSSLTISGAAADAKVTGDELSDLKTQIGSPTEVTWVNGYRLNIKNDVGGTADLTPVVTSTWRYAIVPCTPGTVFRISAIQGGFNYRPYAFIDSNDKILEVGADTSYGYTNHTAIAPANTNRAVFNDNLLTGEILIGYSRIEQLEQTTEQLEQTASRSVISGKKIVFMGDSLFGRFDGDDAIHNIIADKSKATVYNCGFSGTCAASPVTITSSNWDHWFDFTKLIDAKTSSDENPFAEQDYCIENYDTSGARSHYESHLELFKSIDFSEINYLVISYGTNDWYGPYPIYEGPRHGKAFSIIGALQYGIDKILNAYPNIVVVLCTPMYRCEMSGGTFVKDLNYVYRSDQFDGARTLDDISEAIAKLATDKNVACCRFGKQIGINRYTASQYFNNNDGTHPNANGRYLMAQKLLGVLIDSYDGVYKKNVEPYATATKISSSFLRLDNVLNKNDAYIIDAVSTATFNGSLEIGTSNSRDDVVDTIPVSFTENIPVQIEYSPSVSGLSYIRVASHAADITLTVSKTYISIPEIDKVRNNLEKSIADAKRRPLMVFVDDDGVKQDMENWEKITDVCGIRPSCALITGYIGNQQDYPTYLSWEEVRRLQGKGYEFISHTHTHMKLYDQSAYDLDGTLTYTDAEQDALDADLTASVAALDDHGCNYKILVYPHTKYSPEALEVVKRHFCWGVTAGAEINYPPAVPYEIKRESFWANGTSKVTIDGVERTIYLPRTPEEYNALIDECVEGRGLLIFMCHFRTNFDNHYYWTDEYNTLVYDMCKYALSKGVKICTLGEAYNEFKNQFDMEDYKVDCDWVVHS